MSWFCAPEPWTDVAPPYRDVRVPGGKSAVQDRAARHAGRPMAGLASTGVPSIASRASTLIRSLSRATMRARCRPMGFGRLGEQVLNTPVSGWAHVVLGMGAQLVAGRQVESGEHHDLVARPQVLGTLRDLLIEADPRPRRAFALVRRSVEDPQGRLHPPDRHQAVARKHTSSLPPPAGTAHGPAQIDPSALARVGVAGSPRPDRRLRARHAGRG